jgi:hypothetical protein
MKNAVLAAVVSALVSASGGYAASRVLITSTRQIAPPVLAKLAKLKATTSYVQGPQGAPGATGAASTVAGPSGKDGAVGAASIVPGERGLPGESIVGPRGEAGPRGESITGPRGASSVFVVEARVTELRELYAGERLSTAATCPPGSTPLSGAGFRTEPEGIGVITGSGPNEANGWATSFEVTRPPAEVTFVAWANCAE